MANEKRLIDANAFAKCLERMTKTAYPNLFPGLLEAIDYVKDFTTVDAVELPPIKIGDVAYFIIDRKVHKARVYCIRWQQHEHFGISSEISASIGQYTSVGASFDDFWKTVFLTREEAEAELARMNGERRADNGQN